MNEIKTVALPTEGFVRLPTVLSVYPVSKTTWWRGIRSGKFPEPVRLGPGIIAWDVSEIRALIAEHKPAACKTKVGCNGAN